MEFLLFTLGILALVAGLVVFSYLDRVYRELGRVTTGRVHANLDVIEAEVEPRIRMDRRSAALAFGLLANLWLVLTVLTTAAGVSLFVPRIWEAGLQLVFLLTVEVVLGVHFLPYFFLTRTTGRWLVPLLPVLRLFIWLVWPLRAIVEVAISLAHLSHDEELEADSSRRSGQEGIEALVEAAEGEGLLKPEHAELIEQMVEFGDKRVREVMTPRPDIVAIPAQATVEQLRRLLVETKFSRIPVYEGSLDEIVGIVFARDVLHISEDDAASRIVRELVRPALFVPETKLGSQLLKEMQQKRQQMAIVVDEYGSVAGLVTAEDVVEEIVGEISEEDRAPVPDVVREPEGSVVLRGSVSLEKVGELLGVELDRSARDLGSTTIAGLLNAVAGHVPVAGEVVEYDGLRYEVLEANQRKVLRLRARRSSAAADVAGA
jgi:CBS domain containing-hemolysin-like protein